MDEGLDGGASIWYTPYMNNNDRKTLRRLARDEMPVKAGRGAGYHKNKKAYSRKKKHKGKYDG